MMVISEPTEGEPTKKRNGNSRTKEWDDNSITYKEKRYNSRPNKENGW